MDSSLCLLLAVLLAVCLWRRQRDPLNAIPTVGGPSAPLLSYVGAFKFLVSAQKLVQEGYDKYRGRAFKIAMFDQWLVVLSGPELVEQVRKSPDDVISPGEGVLFLTQVGKYVHPDVIKDPYHVEIIRDKLTRQLSAVLPAIVDELEIVCGEHLPTQDGESVALPGTKVLLDIVARVISRAFVGSPTCKNKAYLEAAVSFTIDLVKARMVINMFPEALKAFVSRFITGPTNNLRRVLALLTPVVDERLSSIECLEQGKEEETDTPNDMLQWILEEAHERKEPITNAMTRLQLQNFAAIHTSSNSLTHAYFHLLAHPEIVAPLRGEIENALSVHGWTRMAFDKMWKLDSLLKESQRVSGINILGMIRRAIRDVTLADGTFLPAGTLFAFAAQATHSDKKIYEKSDEFEPFRFSNSREGGESARHQYVNTSSEYIPFGRGKHACPGRFFASLELKLILAYLLLNYDMAFEGKSGRPTNTYFSFSVLPSRDAVVVFRKRSRS